jgi:hypothetical protein
MSDGRDVFDENLKRLLGEAEPPPKMDHERRERVLKVLQTAFADSVPVRAGKRRFAMRMWIRAGGGILAAAAVIAVLALALGRPPEVQLVAGPGTLARRADPRYTDPETTVGEPRQVSETVVALRDDLAEKVEGAPRAQLVSHEQLGGKGRYRTHLSTDKPVYKLGETVYIRGVILDASHHTPMSKTEQATAQLQIKGPKGNVIASGNVSAADSVLGYAWSIPRGQAGGEYTVAVSYPWHGHAPAERTFDIRAYRPPRLKSQIVFLRKGYGPGDHAAATLHVERAEGGFPQGARVVATARVDGAEVAREAATVDGEGNCTVGFDLPAEILRGEGTLAMSIQDGGVVETAAKTIPILLRTVDLVMYPEGGEIAVGLPNRVYLEAKTPAKKPADIACVVVDSNGEEVASFRTQHEGRGRFTFTPALDEKYSLRVVEPAGIATEYPLPAASPTAVVLTAPADVTPASDPVRLGVGVTVERVVSITLSKNETEIAGTRLKVRPGGLAEVVLEPPPTATGVMIATVWDADGKPLAERLVYRRSAETLNVSIETDRPRYVPGGQVEIAVKTTDSDGKPVGAVVGLAVTDDSVLEMIDKREQAPRLPVMVLLEDEVQDLADAHVYLDPDNADAPRALDLLLGTQGWRRFAYVDSAQLIATHGDKAKRLVALRNAPVVLVDELDMVEDIALGGAGDIRDEGALFAAPDQRRRGGLRRMLAPGVVEPKRPAASPVAVGPVVLEKAGKGRLREFDVKADREGVAEARDNLAARADAPRGAKGDRNVAPRRRLAERKKRERVARAEFGARVMRERELNRRPATVVPVRVYAHTVRPGRRPNDRVDFAETLYWNAGLRTDPDTGMATIRFGLSDGVTTFRVFADGFTQRGALGMGTAGVESVEPFYLEPKVPLHVGTGDLVNLPLSLVNATATERLAVTQLSVRIDGKDVAVPLSKLALEADERRRVMVSLDVGATPGERELSVKAVAGPYSDEVVRTIVVTASGYPVETAFGGQMKPGARARHVVEIPASVALGSVRSNAAVYPTPLANMTESLKRLMREPHGCFEQTSSTTYPLVMAQQYFTTHHGVDPKIIERSQQLLDRGYKKLTGFECPKRGYEWFGRGMGHEALTAYGLMEFVDMAKVSEVDRVMIQRTREWLLARRDGKGGFERNKKALDSFGRAPSVTTNAYIVWTLVEAGEKGLEREIAAVAEDASVSKDSYVLALAANILAATGDADGARSLMATLAAKQNARGAVEGATTSITRSGGRALSIETTSLAALAWMRDAQFTGNVAKAMKFIAESCKGGRYGSTQSTVLALRAIVTHDKLNARPGAGGRARLLVDGRPVGGWIDFGADEKGSIALPDLGKVLTPGSHAIELAMENGSVMPYSLAVNYVTGTPASSRECTVKLTTSLVDERLDEGTTTEAKVVVENLTDEGRPMTVAIVGVPGGLEPRHDQLKELVKSGQIAAYEVTGRDVVLYWRDMAPREKKEIALSLLAAVPGVYTGPASRAYLYYTDEHKHWVPGAKVIIGADSKPTDF